MKGKTGNKIVLSILILLFLGAWSGCTEKNPALNVSTTKEDVRIVIDMAGREVVVPTQIEKVFPTSPVGVVLLYTLDPDLLMAWNDELRQGESPFINKKYLDLPHLGGWYAKTTCNVEELLKIQPDLIFAVSCIDDMAISQADTIEAQLGIPVVILSSDLDKLDATYACAGEILNLMERAVELGTYCRETVEDIQKKAQSIPQEKGVTVYYAEGPTGLQTEPKGSGHTQILDVVGGINVADVVMTGGKGLTPVSLEQILAWNPAVILSWNIGQGGYYENISGDPRWANIAAVKNKKVYAIPGGPFNWFERPPSVNQILGLKWLGNLLYPEVYHYDIVEETRVFYKKFYHYALTDAELTYLLKDAGGR